MTSRPLLTIVLLLAPIVFLAQIGKRDIVTSHEARVAQTARQMAAVGWPWEPTARLDVPVTGLVEHDGDRRLAPLPRAGKMTVNPWLVPVINGQARLQKPPLPYWCTAVVFRAFGVGEGWARLVPAILGATMTILVADLARLILGRRAMLPAAIVWTTTLFAVDEFRKSMADPYLSFFTLLTIWTWLRGGRAWTIAFYVSIALGLLAKGPPLLVPLVPALVLARLLLKRRSGAGIAIHGIGVILLVAIAAPWTIYVLRHVPNALQLWIYEIDNVEKARPWWLYLGTIFVNSGLWTPIWIAGVVLPSLHMTGRGVRSLLSPRNRRRLFAIGWLLAVVIFFSCKPVKKDAYLLPVAPAIALAAADAISIMFAWTRRRLGAMPAVLALMQAAIGIGFAAAMVVMCWRMTLDRAAGISVAVVALVTAVGAALLVRRLRCWLALQGLAYALIAVAFVGFYRPDRDQRRSPKPFARAVARYVQETGVPLWRDQLPEEATFYLPLDLPTTDESDTTGPTRAIVLVDDSRNEIDRGKLKPDESFFRAYVRDVPIVNIRRLTITPNGGGRWKAFELTLDRTRA